MKTEPTAQSRATAKWDEKAGMTSKSYKLKIDVVQSFADECAKRGETQSEALMTLMRTYINEDKPHFLQTIKKLLKIKRR